MKTLAHLSDVHFGREDPDVVEGLVRSVAETRPDVIVISGDLTQRAKKRQFRAARAFLRELPDAPKVIVPGNHDVSWTNLLERALQPLARYRRYITADMSPFFEDGEMAIAGINTVRVGAVKDGRINRRQMREACDQFGRAAEGAVRIVVMHHPIVLVEGDEKHALVGRAEAAMKEFARCRVDLFLSGHLHAGVTLSTSRRYPLPGYSAVMAQAGTAVSTRTRGEANAWNLIRVSPASAGTAPLLEVQQMEWSGKRFRDGRIDRFARQPDGWMTQQAGATAGPPE